jgi:hypothetical protein
MFLMAAHATLHGRHIHPLLTFVLSCGAGAMCIQAKTGKTKEEPFPISVRRTIPQPEIASEWDISQ